MKKENIKEKEEVKKVFYIYCPKCGKEIKGNSRSMAWYNIKIHLDKHKRNDK